MSPRVGAEAESGSAAVPRNTDHEQRPKLTVWSGTAPQAKAPTPVDRIGKLTVAELAELAPPEARGVQSGAFSKRFGQEALDWSAFRNPTPLPPPPAAEPIQVPSAVQPFYGALPEASDRAELHISDLSVELANPFVGSSLNPPPPSKRPWLRPLLITFGGCLLIGSGYLGAVYHVERHAASAFAKWTGAEVTPVIALVFDAPPNVATTPSAPVAEPNAAQAAALEPASAQQGDTQPIGEAEHTLTTVEEVFTVEEAAAEPELSEVAPVEPQVASVGTTAATDSAAVAKSPRARRRAARAAAAAQTAAKVVEAKPEAPAAEPVEPAPPRVVLAPNPYVSRAAPVVAPVTPAPAAAVAGPVPQTLSRAQVQNALESMRDQLQSCAAGAHGRITANVTISGAGRVTYSIVHGAFAGTPQGSCMARALRGAQFPQFASPQLRVVYPFAL